MTIEEADLLSERLLAGVVNYAMQVPTDRRFYSRADNRLRDFLLDLGDIGWAMHKSREETKREFLNGGKKPVKGQSHG